MNLTAGFRLKLILSQFTVATLLYMLMISNNHLVSSNSDIYKAFNNEILELTSSNYDESTKNYRIVVLNFYADWCPYSARWKPVFQATAKSIYNETYDLKDPNAIIFGQVNCEIETTLAQRFRITKFPTTKLTLFGKPIKKEYRGARNAEAFKEYIKKVLADPLIYAKNPADLSTKIEDSKGAVILYSMKLGEKNSDSPLESEELRSFRHVAQFLREDCQFIYAFKEAASNKIPPSGVDYKFAFKPHHKGLEHEIDMGYKYSSFQQLLDWARENCIPIVREITFENAEELTEIGLPFVILFYDSKDKTWIEVYKKIITDQLRLEANKVTFLYADGHLFSLPLKHLGKTPADLPVLAIDSFRHLFLYRQPIETISQPGKLKQFIDDLHSGKLDREFYFGPDSDSQDTKTSPPESAFNKLSPSAYRYSLLPRDEL